MTKVVSRKSIEDFIPEIYDGKIRDGLLDLIKSLRENKMNPAPSSASTWKISYKGCVVCYFRYDSDAKKIAIHPIIGEYEPSSLSDELKEIVWANKITGRYCYRCHACSYTLNRIFGREYSDACGQSIVFTNPSDGEIEYIIKLLEMRRYVIKHGKLLPTLPRNFG